MKDPFCDENGVCTPADLSGEQSRPTLREDVKIIYIGDPMCSWCWGIANHVAAIRSHYEQQSIGFEIVVGGLRPGGGEVWDDKMKDFLRHHWKEVNERSGQPFGYNLFDKSEFNYDTEPACRAVVVAKSFLDQAGVLQFFEAVQRKFYVESEDPTVASFYEGPCKQVGIPFAAFLAAFESDEKKDATNNEFMLNRQWGVRGYPTVVLQIEKQLYLVANGYASEETLKERIDQLLQELPTVAAKAP